MTDDQFNKLLAVQTAQLYALEGIMQAAMAMAVTQGKTPHPNWDRVKQAIDNAKTIR